jgi:hypothetical protein
MSPLAFTCLIVSAAVHAAAWVALERDDRSEAAEQQALASLGMPSEEVLALCGTLTGDPATPLRINHALTATGQWLEVTP